MASRRFFCACQRIVGNHFKSLASSATSASPKILKLRLPAALAIGSSASLLAYDHYQKIFHTTVSAATVPSTREAEVDSMASKARSFNFIADAVEKAAPAVVFIEVEGSLFGFTMPIAYGSGFIVEADGLILTNAHVVQRHNHVNVKLPDGRTFQGAVLAIDPVSDLAVVRIEAQNLPFLSLGDSSRLRPGEWVIAMGSPFNLTNTVTAGIISSVHRGSQELGLNTDMKYIQTDAVINVGNSGGPLVNLDGEAIGINSMKVTAGISFAIPSNYVHAFLVSAKKALQQGSPIGPAAYRRYLGISMFTLHPALAADLRARNPNFPMVDLPTVYVENVHTNSPAQIAGIRPGDIILSINGRRVTKTRDVYGALESSDRNLVLQVARGNEVLKLTVVPEIIKPPGA